MYLDTHIVIWLYEKALDKFSSRAKYLLNSEELKLSPVIRLELQFLYEINRLKIEPDQIIDELRYQLGVNFYDDAMIPVIHHAMNLTWTRDLFDRLIVATADYEQAPLLTNDELILQNYSLAVWDE